MKSFRHAPIRFAALLRSAAALATLALLLAPPRLRAEEKTADGISLTLRAPAGESVAGTTVAVELLALNSGDTPAQFAPPAEVEARLAGGERSWLVTLRGVETGAMEIAPGGFRRFRYELLVPKDCRGLIVLETLAAGQPVARAAWPVTPGATGPEPERKREPFRRIAGLRAAADEIERTFQGRLSAHEPIYFVYGPDAPAAKFQFSFKYRLLNVTEGTDTRLPMTLQAGYTQRSLWDIDAESSPFYDTSYMPEFFVESLAPLHEEQPVRWLGYRVAFKHESNGRAGDVSRSLNTVYLRSGFVLGRMENWHLIVAPEIFLYVGSRENNPDIADYRGYGQLRVAIGRYQNGPALTYTGHVGRGWERFTHQVDLTVPFKTSLLDLETYLLVQYFNGYGESLLSYRDKFETVRAGISFVR